MVEQGEMRGGLVKESQNSTLRDCRGAGKKSLVNMCF